MIEELKSEDSKSTLLEEIKEFVKSLEDKEKSIADERKLLEEEKKDFELHKMNFRNEQIQSVIEKYGINLKPNQKVYAIYSRSEFIECPHCNNGEVTQTINGVKYYARCPHCDGYGGKHKFYHDIAEGTLQSAEIHLYWNTDEGTVTDGYRCDASTVGVNNLTPESAFNTPYKVFNRKDIYLTRSDAKKAIKKMIKDDEEYE